MSRLSHTDEERTVITEFAGSAGKADPALREAAIAAHRALLARSRHGAENLPYGDPHFEFMREVDTPMPDLGLRATYRRLVTEGARPASAPTSMKSK